jgi:DNA polymerase
MTACWQGQVQGVLAELCDWQARLGAPEPESPENDPRPIVARVRTYLQNNASRMNYPQYRQEGLPITSCLVESLIKQLNQHVKGTEQFWNRPDAPEGEAILQATASLLSDASHSQSTSSRVRAPSITAAALKPASPQPLQTEPTRKVNSVYPPFCGILSNCPRHSVCNRARREETTMTARDFVPPDRNLAILAEAASSCRGCELYKAATQTVFGEGSATASMMVIGEVPGDREDIEGRPFVGPAGRLLEEALQEAGIDRSDVYITNAVKHFKWTPAGKRRLHKKPSAREITACAPWLEAEMEAVQPHVAVCLGATAAQALLGRAFRITQRRGELIEGNHLVPWILATWHPSAVLRAPDSESRSRMRAEMVGDLKVATRELQRAGCRGGYSDG